MTYNRDQLMTVVPYLPGPPKWFILGGPADANEAQTAKELWPDVKVLGVEPCDKMREWQWSHGWPKEGVMVPAALSDGWGWATMVVPEDNPRCSSLMSERPGRVVNVKTTTLDLLDEQVGPFEDVFLWLDIEGWESRALKGGERIFSGGKVYACNLEFIERRTTENSDAEAFLARHGFRLVHTWNQQPGLCEDRVYVR